MADQSIPTIQQKGGDVGIGTSSDLARLTILSDSAAQSIGLIGRSGDNISTIRWWNNAANTIYTAIESNANYTIYNTVTNGYASFFTNNTERARITAGGFVGINESAPGYRLQVTDSNQYVAGFINNVANQLATVTVQNSALSTAGVNTGAATFELVGKAGSSTHGRHAWIGAEGVASETFRTKLLFKIRGESNTGYTWSGASAAPTIVTMDGNGQVSFNQYTSASSFTGTAAGVLAFDSSGNIITQSATLYPSGSGTTNTLTKWTGTNTLGNSIASESGSTLTIAGTSIITSAGTERYIGLLGYNSAYSFIRSNVGFGSSYNSMTFLVNFNSDTSTQGNAAVPSWIMDLGGNIPDTDAFNISRSPAGSFSFTRLFKVTNAGDGIFRSTITATSATANDGSPAAGLFNSGNDGGVVWRGAITAVHNADVTINTGASIGITFQPLASTGSSFYGAAKIAGVRPNATANNQDTDLVFWTRTGASNSTTDSEKMRITNGGLVGIGTTNPLAGLQVEKYGSKFDSDVQYNQPAGNVFLSVTGSVANQDNWFGIRGNYGSSSGSSNLLLQANYRDIGSQAGHYISSKATNLGNADFEIGKLVTLTSISTPPNKVPQLYIAGGGNVGIGTVSPNVTGFGGATALTIQASIQPVLELIGSTYNASGVFGGGVVQFRNSSTAVATLGVENLTGNQGNMVFYTNNGTSNTERMRITSAGNVGINTTGPICTLDLSDSGAVISGTATVNSNMKGLRVYNTTSATQNNAVGIWFSTGPHQAGIASFRATPATTWETTLAFYTHVDTTSNLNDATEKMRITGNGLVGIGTTTPARALDVNGEIRTQTGTIDFSNDFNNQIYVLSNAMTIKTNGSDRVTIDSAGRITQSLSTGAAAFGNGINIFTQQGTYTTGHGGILQFQNEDVITAGIRGVRASGWGSSMAFYVHNASAGNTFGTTFVERMRIIETGDVGIGTNAPSTRFVVYDDTQDRFNIRIQSTIANNNNKYMGIGFSGEESNTKGAIFFQSIGQSYSRGRMIFAINDVADQSSATPSNAVLTLANNGAATFVSSVTATSFFESSDSRIKTLLDNTINYTLVANVEARYYEKNGVQELGYFAQDFENILPSAVQKDDKDFLNLSYTQVHTAKIAALEARVKELESQLKNK